MSHCNLLDDYLDRDLSPAARDEFEDHLSECESCRAAVAECGMLYAALADKTADDEVFSPDMSAEIAEGIQTLIAESPLPANRPSRPPHREHKIAWQWIAAAAVVLVAGVLAMQLWGSADEFANNPPSSNQENSTEGLSDADHNLIPDRNRNVDALLAARAGAGHVSDDPNAVSPSDSVVGNNAIATANNSREVLPSLVRQVGESRFDQLKVKSNNPKVTIVWMMEPPKEGAEPPRP